MKVVPNVEALERAFTGAYDNQRELVIEWLYDALPAPPLAEDVQAAVQQVQSIVTAMNVIWAKRDPRMRYGEYQFDAADMADLRTLITALHAATELARQYREDYEASVAAGAEVNRQITERDATIAKLRAAVTAWDATLSTYCDGPERDAVRAALAGTPPADVVVVPQAVAELLALPGIERVCWERGEWDAEWRVGGKLYGDEGYLSPDDLLAAIKALTEAPTHHHHGQHHLPDVRGQA